ncbi:hypothetical protein U3516DRAFT_739097 [Neocallimastix sp. 'constans']
MDIISEKEKDIEKIYFYSLRNDDINKNNDYNNNEKIKLTENKILEKEKNIKGKYFDSLKIMTLTANNENGELSQWEWEKKDEGTLPTFKCRNKMGSYPLSLPTLKDKIGNIEKNKIKKDVKYAPDNTITLEILLLTAIKNNNGNGNKNIDIIEFLINYDKEKYANDNKIPLEINERDENGNIVIFRIL